MHARFVQQPSIARRAAVVALLLMLVLSQALGWIHRTLHDPATAASLHGVQVTSGHAAHASALHDLFGSHSEPTDCRLFDLLGQPGCASPPVLVLPVLLPASYLALTHADFVARWAALFDARGPPTSR